MGRKFIPTDEQLKTMVAAYEKEGTYAAAAKSIGVSTAVATRVLKEHYQDNDLNIYEYKGGIPEEPDKPLEKAMFYHQLFEFAKEYLTNGN